MLAFKIGGVELSLLNLSVPEEHTFLGSFSRITCALRMTDPEYMSVLIDLGSW